jgi:lipopolysaccharide transport system permease protein
MDRSAMQEIEAIQPFEWNDIIKPDSSLFDLPLKEIWRYRDLLILLVKRDFVATYKQTILGPLWFFLQPLLTTLMFTLVFGRIAGLSTDGLPSVLFYLSGITLWNYFAECLNRTANVFKDNEGIFGKVYFPRLIMPLSIVMSHLVKLAIQLFLFLTIWLWYTSSTNLLHPNWAAFLLPVLILIIGTLGLGLGMIISSLTTKYRDLVFILSFAVQLLMYATPIIYPLSSINVRYKHLIELNPLTSIVETFRYGFLGTGEFSWSRLIYSASFAVVALITGTLIFNKVEKSFMDTV